MHTSFVSTQTNRFDRNFGGTSRGVADPYISGYSFIYFKALPSQLATIMENDKSDLGWLGGSGTLEEVRRILSASMLAVTPPGGTLNKAEFIGLGGTKWSVPTNIDYGNTLTMRFLEYSRLPILDIFHSWFRLIREYRYGVTGLQGSIGPTSYTKSAYSGTMLYWTTKPDGITVEYSACYAGVFPTRDPQDLYAGDITANDKLELDMEFSLDWVWKEKWVREECQTMANLFAGEGFVNRGLPAEVTPDDVGLTGTDKGLSGT